MGEPVGRWRCWAAMGMMSGVAAGCWISMVCPVEVKVMLSWLRCSSQARSSGGTRPATGLPCLVKMMRSYP